MATPEFEFDVFLSHNSKDKPRVRRIAEALKKAGLQVWLDEWVIAPGDDIFLAIERGLESSRTLVLFLSPAAIGSDWVGLERSTALFRDPTNKARRFVPVLLEDCKLPDTLKRYAYLDFRTEEDAGVAALVAACKGEPLPPPTPSTPTAPTPGKKRAQPKPQNKGQALRFWLLTTAGLIGCLLLWLLFANTEMLARFGLTGPLFYVALIPFALLAAGVLFTSLRSVASFRGEALGGRLEMGGPAVLFALVMLGGFMVIPPPMTPFSVTVYVHGPKGTHDLVLRGKGAVILDLDQDRRREAIGDKGQAVFSEIAPTFRGREVPAGLTAEGFTLAESSRRVKLASSTVYLEVKRLEVEIRGRVIDGQSRPIAGATVRLREQTTSSAADGTFVLRFPGEWADEPLILGVNAPGFKPWQAEVFADSNDVDVLLDGES